MLDPEGLKCDEGIVWLRLVDEKDEGEKVDGELAVELGADVVCWNPLCTAAAAAAMEDGEAAE